MNRRKLKIHRNLVCLFITKKLLILGSLERSYTDSRMHTLCEWRRLSRMGKKEVASQSLGAPRSWTKKCRSLLEEAEDSISNSFWDLKISEAQNQNLFRCTGQARKQKQLIRRRLGNKHHLGGRTWAAMSRLRVMLFRSVENDFMLVRRLWNSRNNIVNENAEARSVAKPDGKGKRATHTFEMTPTQIQSVHHHIHNVQRYRSHYITTIIPIKFILSVINDYLGFTARGIFILCILLSENHGMSGPSTQNFNYSVPGHYPSFCSYLKTQNIFQTGFYLRLQVEPTQLGPIDVPVSGH
jgi:hypothetical protein